MTDIVEKLRDLTLYAWADGQDDVAQTVNDAATEIEQLRAALKLIDSGANDPQEIARQALEDRPHG